MKKLYKATVSLEVLIPEYLIEHFHDMNLQQIEYEAREGDFSMIESGRHLLALEHMDEIEYACRKHGTDVEFFFPKEEDNDVQISS